MAWDIRADRPVYLQLVEHLQTAVVTGEYPPGSRIPPVRKLAGQAGVNPNTMQRALAELETQGLVETHRTSGRTVTENRQTVEDMKQALARGCAGEYVKNMGRLGISQPEAARMAAEYKEESV